MICLSRAALVASLAVLSAAASARENPAYIGGAVNSLGIAEIGSDNETELSSAYGRFGVFIDRYTSFELRIGTGLGDEQFFTPAGGVDIELDTVYGAYLRGSYPLFDRIHPYLLLGYSWVDVASSDSSRFAAEENEDISFGIGVDVLLTPSAGFNIEYTQYIKEDGIELSGPALGVVVYFPAD